MPQRPDQWRRTPSDMEPKMVRVNGKLIYPTRPGGRLTRLSYVRATAARRRKESQ